MIKKDLIFILFVLAVISSGCKKSEDSTTEFSNKIELGTGVSTANPFILTGVGTTFASTATIYFRLEAQDDMGGSAVKIQVMRSNGTLYNAWEFPSPQSYGHIMVSSFRIADAGNFTVTGILVNGNKTVASIAVVIN
jgi:hypothetical protein